MPALMLPRPTHSPLPLIILAALICSQLALLLVRPLTLPPPAVPLRSEPIAPGSVPHSLTPTEWAGITDQIAAGPYRTYPNTDGSYASANPAHGWQITYGTDGTTQLTPRDPDATPWQWGLRLAGYGFTDLVDVPNTPLALQPADQHLTYQWDGVLDEWWRNGTNGLEQGFTVHARPAGGSAGTPLRVLLAVNGDLHGTPIADGLAFHNAAGESLLTYTKLYAWDATGRTLPTALTLEDGQIALTVDDTNAVYPLTIDPLIQQAYLKASNTDAGDAFGHEVALDGDTIVVGAPYEDSNATGVDGNPADNSATDSGAVYVFVRSAAGEWRQQAYLKASNTDTYDSFGYSVAIAGDTIVVGAPGEDSSGTGVNGDEANNSVFSGGAAYVFVRSGGTWSQQAYLKASNPDETDQFGYSVAIAGDIVVVSANIEDSSATGMNGDEDNNSATDSGAVYAFLLDRIPPTVTINRAVEQADPTNNDPIRFTVVFSENVTGFTAEDVLLDGTAPGPLRATVTGSGSTYTVSVSGMSGPGTVTATLPDGAAQDAAGNLSRAANTSTVTFDATPPTVTITRAADQPNATNSAPIRFTVVFSEDVTGFTVEDVALGGTAPGPLTASVSGSGATYTVSVGGMSGSGTVTASISADAAQDAAGNASLASTTGTVTFDITPPMVTFTVYVPLVQAVPHQAVQPARVQRL